MDIKLNEKVRLLESDNLLLIQKLKQKNREIQNLKRKLKQTESKDKQTNEIEGQTNIFDFIN